jgi:hypothetical protein
MSNGTIPGEVLPPRGPRERFDGDFARFGPEDLRRDAEHLRLLSIFYFILAGLQLLGVLFGLIYSVVGGVVMTVGAVAASEEGIVAIVFGAVFLVVGVFVLTVGLLYAYLLYLTGRSLRDGKRRTFCFVMAILLCVLGGIIGIVLGIFTIVVLSRESVQELFKHGGLASPPAEDA